MPQKGASIIVQFSVEIERLSKFPFFSSTSVTEREAKKKKNTSRGDSLVLQSHDTLSPNRTEIFPS